MPPIPSIVLGAVLGGVLISYGVVGIAHGIKKVTPKIVHVITFGKK